MQRSCFLLVLCFSVQIMALNVVVPMSDKTAFHFHQFLEPCSNKKLITRYENVKIVGGRCSAKRCLFDYDFIVDRDTTVNYLNFRFKKCPNPETLDACSSFPLIKTSNFCGVMTSDKDAWSPMMQCANPRIKCPFKKGVYHARNCSLDMAAFNLFPLGSRYWYLESDILDENKEQIFCQKFHGRVIRA